MVNDQQKVSVTINNKTVQVPSGQHTMQQLSAYLGVPTAVKLTVTDPVARNGSTFNPNHSLIIQGGETITSA